MTTVYSPQYAPLDTNGYLRAGVTYSTTETQVGVVFSGTLILQHNGAALSSLFGGWSAGIDHWFGYIRDMIVVTAAKESISAHSTWTTIASVQFSKTFDKRSSSYIENCRLGIESDIIYPGIVGPYEEINIEIPALESWDVTYDANGGTNVPSTQKKYYGKDLTLSSSQPSRTNYNFYHWNTQPNNSGTTYEPGATYTDNAALALYSIWNAQVRYNMNGGVAPPGSGLAGTQKKTYGVNLTLLTAVPTRTGYVFNGWNTAADGTGTAFQPGGTYSAEISVTLYAQWLSLPAKPSIPTMTAIRWNETTDQQDDTGTSAKVTAGWNIDTTSEYYGNTNTGTVTLTVTPQSGSSSHTITPISGTSGASGTAVFMVSGLDTDMQYTCKVTVTDLNASSERSVILTRAFFIMDFKAGGQGIGIGRAAPNSGLEVGYNTTFDQNVNVYENENIEGNLTVEGITTHTGRISANGNIFANARMRVQKGMLAMDAELRGDLRVSGYGGVSVGRSASLDDLYVAVTDETKPTFVSGKFYSRGYNSTIRTIAYTQLTSEPSDWNTAWTSYYRAKSGNGLLKITYDTEFDGDVNGIGTNIPTADEVAEFDSTAHMNSTDMTSQEVEDFIDGLNVGGGGLVVESAQYGSCYIKRYGRIRMLTIGTGAGYNVGTLPSKDIPIDVVNATGRVYNGSTYVTCVIQINNTTGAVTFSDEWGGTVTGAQLGYLRPRSIMYISKE